MYETSSIHLCVQNSPVPIWLRTIPPPYKIESSCKQNKAHGRDNSLWCQVVSLCSSNTASVTRYGTVPVGATTAEYIRRKYFKGKSKCSVSPGQLCQAARPTTTPARPSKNFLLFFYLPKRTANIYFFILKLNSKITGLYPLLSLFLLILSAMCLCCHGPEVTANVNYNELLQGPGSTITSLSLYSLFYVFSLCCTSRC